MGELIASKFNDVYSAVNTQLTIIGKPVNALQDRVAKQDELLQKVGERLDSLIHYGGVTAKSLEDLRAGITASGLTKSKMPVPVDETEKPKRAKGKERAQDEVVDVEATVEGINLFKSCTPSSSTPSTAGWRASRSQQMKPPLAKTP